MNKLISALLFPVVLSAGTCAADRVVYTERVSSVPQLRGAMSPGGLRCTEKDVADLAAAGATVIRFQLNGLGDYLQQTGRSGEYDRADAPGADRYMADCIDLFNEYGWDWAFHVWRENRFWNVGKAFDFKTFGLISTTNNARYRVLMEGFRPQAAARPAQDVSGFDLALDHPTSVWHRSPSAIRAKAQRQMRRAFSPVTDKSVVPPSGDRHDYISLGRYWWPDPTKPDGKPYVRRDGEVNPECLDTDSSRLGAVVESVTWLTAAALRLRDGTAGREAARRAKAFFLDEETRMNPNLNFGQSIPGVCDGRGIGIIDTYLLVSSDFLDALKVLHGLGYLDDVAFAGFQDWFARYLTWMETSKNGRDEARQKNNHGTAYDVQRIAYADFSAQREKARAVLAEVARRRIDGKITPEGRQPLEDARTKGVDYSMYQLGMYCRLAYYGERYGIDIWGHVTPNGASIATAMAFMRPYCLKEKPWPFKQITDFSTNIFNYCQATAEHFAAKEK